MYLKSFRFKAPFEFDGRDIKTFLRRYCGLSARSLTLTKYYENGITVDGERVKTDHILKSGDIVTVTLPEEENDIAPVCGELDILYEDEYLLIVSKPSGMPVHPVKVHQDDTLANIVAFYQYEKGERYTFRAMNRLDKDTSGCVVIAKDRITYGLLSSRVDKTYLAVCEGELRGSGVIDRNIALSPDSKIKRAVSQSGQRAITRYETLGSNGGVTALKLTLETGRTHQIRCHMSDIDHPLCGDDLYGGSLELISRQALHCYKIRFVHPFDKREIEIIAPVPDDMLSVLHLKAVPIILS